MTAFDRVLLRLAGWAGLADDRQHELVADARLASTGPHSGPVRELWSVIAFVLQVRSRRATDGDAVRTFRQGARLGAGLAFVCALLLIATEVATADRLALLVILAGPTVAWFTPNAHIVRVSVLAASTVALLHLAGEGALDPLVITLLLVANGGLAIGDSQALRSASRDMRFTAVAVVALATVTGLAAVVDPSVIVLAVQVLGVGVIPAAMLAIGRLDPRLAVAATSVVIARFGTFDRSDLIALVDGSGDVGIVLLRCALMLSFVAAGALATRSALRHHTSI